MLNLLRLTLVTLFFLLQSCQHLDENDEPIGKRKNLSKAAAFNVQLGLGYLKQGDRSRAKQKLLTAYQQEPSSADVNAALGYYFEKSSELDEAKKYYLKAIALSSNGGAQLNNYGTFLCRQGDYKKADAYFLKAVHDMQYVNTAGAYENAGLCAMAVPDFERAKEYFIYALKHDPSKKQSLYELVKLQGQSGHYEDALAQLQKYPELVLTDKVLVSLAKDIAMKAGQEKLAAEYENNEIKLGQNTDNSGVDNEYNSHNG